LKMQKFHYGLLLFNTTRRKRPPSTRASIAMDGGVADTYVTTRANTNRIN